MNSSENKPSAYLYGPQYKKDSPFTARMRFHQSWYRVNVLGLPWGTGPDSESNHEWGNMLDREGGAKGFNFLTPEIFNVAKCRIKEATGTVDEYRLLHNMLSSQPMCFNLFGPMVADRDLAKRVFKSVLPQEVEKVTNVMIEYAPEPAGEYLGDRTAFDAFVEFLRPDGQQGFIGIETKLTEPFSKAHYDGPAYRRWVERPESSWPQENWKFLDDIRYNQLWRDHLLAVAMRNHSKSSYACGYLMLVRHPADSECDQTTQAYRSLLKREDSSFLDFSLDKLLGPLNSNGENGCECKWLSEFKKRYLDFSVSEKEWQAVGRKEVR
jgi:hypothetical protein